MDNIPVGKCEMCSEFQTWVYACAFFGIPSLMYLGKLYKTTSLQRHMSLECWFGSGSIPKSGLIFV